jgi:dihydroxyacetone kinase
MAHGAPGNVFASPSSQQVIQSLRSLLLVGVLPAFSNYAGDVLHFGQALGTAKS